MVLLYLTNKDQGVERIYSFVVFDKKYCKKDIGFNFGKSNNQSGRVNMNDYLYEKSHFDRVNLNSIDNQWYCTYSRFNCCSLNIQRMHSDKKNKMVKIKCYCDYGM